MGIKEVITEMRDQAIVDRRDTHDQLLHTDARNSKSIADARALFEYSRGYADALNDVLRTLVEKGLLRP